LTAGVAIAAGAANAQTTYVLNGYSFGAMRGVNTAELEARLKEKPGARITRADVEIDRAIVQREIEARHLKGQVYATIAEKKGRVWIIFDLLDLSGPPAGMPVRHLELQHFEGTSRIAASALAAASGLKKGDQLSAENINVARRAILAMYAKAMRGKPISLKARLQIKADGRTTITWIVKETK
jgi:outer membrane protein assembly factor BamA